MIYSDNIITESDNGYGWGSFFQTVCPRLPLDRSFFSTCSPDSFADRRHLTVIVPNELPTRDQLDLATTKFFAEVNSVINILNFAQFQEIVEDLYHLGQASTNANIAIVLGVTALVSGSDTVLDQACQYLDSSIAEGSLESIQAIMILVSAATLSMLVILMLIRLFVG